MGEQIFSWMKVHKNEVLSHLYKIYWATLLSSCDGDFDFLKEYAEETFLDKLRSWVGKLKEQGYTLLIEEDQYADKGVPMQIEANMYDHTVIKGLQINWKHNGTVDDYTINNDIDTMGFISYVPKYI